MQDSMTTNRSRRMRRTLALLLAAGMLLLLASCNEPFGFHYDFSANPVQVPAVTV